MARGIRNPLGWLGGLLVLYLAVPIVAFLARLAAPGDRGFTAPGLWGAFGTSVAAASISTCLIALFGIPLAYVLAHAQGRLAAVVRVVIQLPLALPPVMGGIVLIYLVGPYTPVGRLFDGRLTDSLAGIVIAQTFVASPFLVVAARSAFAAVDPALDDLAASLGHGRLARFWKVALPSAAEGVRAGLLMAWLRSLGEYGATVLLAYHPYSLPVFTEVQFSGAGLPNTQAPALLALLVAAAAVAVGYLRLPRRRARAVLPVSRAPEPGSAVAVTFDLDVRVGGFHLSLAHEGRASRLAVLGPSGSGKSVTLRALAGLIGAGAEVRYETVAGARAGGDQHPPRIGYVPQGGVLFPGRTVWQQLTFGVGADPRLAAWWLDALHLTGLEERMPEQLSGGQRQRVAFAQAFSRSPDVVLLDEPFSALDAPVREELRMHLRRLQHENALSTVLVTHDPEEAALLADEIIVISDGRVLQAGRREDVYATPASAKVARLLGIRNVNRGVFRDGAIVTSGGALVPVAADGAAARLAEGADVLWCVRPEHAHIGAEAGVPAVVVDSADLGTFTTTTVRLVGGPELQVRGSGARPLRVGEQCRIVLPPEQVIAWPR